MRIGISGLVGTGKTTVSKLLVEKTNYQYISAGELFRNIAQEMNMDVKELCEYAKTDITIDKIIDEKIMAKILEEKNIIAEGRLVGWFLYRKGIPSYKILLTADKNVRVERIKQREKKSELEALQEIELREASELDRYWKIYTIDINDVSIYNMVIDSTYLTPKQIVYRIFDEIKSYI